MGRRGGIMIRTRGLSACDKREGNSGDAGMRDKQPTRGL
jgi:hypothetical protein